jgi:hypothetical protein
MERVLIPLKKIDPLLQHIRLDKKKAESFPELLLVLKNHTQSTDFMIQFFKKPLIEDCNCKACSENVFKPVRMPLSVYEKVLQYPMPMPIPKPTTVGDTTADLHYMSFADAQVLPFTNAHQPSLAATVARLAAAAKKKAALAASKTGAARLTSSMAYNITKLKNKTAFKIGISNRVRGVVACKDCHKPRCIYSLSALSHMKPPLPQATQGNVDDIVLAPAHELHMYRTMARDRLHDAMESPIFVCGMAPLDPDDPCYDVFHCDPSLDCNAHIEANFYTSKIQPTRVELCCHCAGEFDSPVELNSSLKAPDGPYSVVLPACKLCLNNGCHIIVRGARQNAQAKQDKIDAKAAREARREAEAMASAGAATTSPAAEATLTSHAKKSRKRTATRYNCMHMRVHAYCIAKHIAPLILFITMICCA